MNLYTNMTAKKTVRNALLTYAQGITNLNIASAFFDANEDILEIAKRGININLVVRLSEGTSIQSLKALLNKTKINVRYYTDRKFHPKIYIFGDQRALIGSANTTKAGINSNSEVSILIEQDSDEFDELVSLFSDYWDNADPLTEDTIKAVEPIFNKKSSQESSMESEIANALGGNVAPPTGIVISHTKKTKQKLYIDDYEREYQFFKSAYDQVHDIYLRHGKRRVESKDLPLRIEIDQLWNYIRERLSKGDNHNEQPVRSGQDLEKFVISTIESWMVDDFPYLKKVVENYWIINDKFRSKESIENLESNELFDLLMICHAFQENMRYFGVHDIALKRFYADVSENKLKEMIAYLLYNTKDRFTYRMAECILGPYKIDHIGRRGVQELLGWVNQQEIPICNKRTMIGLRYLGVIDGIIKV